MIYITSFRNYEEFKEIFGVRKFDGRKARNNKILLSLLKDRKLFKESVKSGDLSLFGIKNMVDLRNIIYQKLRNSGAHTKKLSYQVLLLGQTFYSDKYSLDELNGICEDGTPNAVRYVNHENDRVWKMKAGKFMKHLIEATKFGRKLPESIVIWLMEEFSRDWQSHVIGKLPKNKLYVNDNFGDIYNSKRLKGYDTDPDSFISCMVGKGLHTFYKNAVTAKAAYLEDETGMIIARCVIFTEVYDEDDKIWRYAERQYSYKGNEVYKQALIDALIQAGEIDCYKKIGASCHDSSAIVDIHGNSLADKKFQISCDLEWDSTVSYQDTFKHYSMYNKTADNYGRGDYSLDITEGSLENADSDDDDDEPQEWDSYHERDAWEVCNVYYHGNEETCDIECREDFEEYEGTWYHEDDLVRCPECGRTMLNPKYYDDEDDGVYSSDVTEDSYCCEDCRDKAEDAYKKEHWYYSDYDNEWYKKAEDIVTYHAYDCISLKYVDQTISRESLTELLEEGEMYLFQNDYYDVINEEVGKPYGLEDVIQFIM